MIEVRRRALKRPADPKPSPREGAEAIRLSIGGGSGGSTGGFPFSLGLVTRYSLLFTADSTIVSRKKMVVQMLLKRRGNTMKNSKYRVYLNEEERGKLQDLLRRGSNPARKVMRARILLKADENGAGWTDNQIATAVEVGLTTIGNVRQQYVKEGLERTLERHPAQREYERCLDGAGEAHLLALACSPAPQGQQRWTLRLLAEHMVALGYAEHISHESVRQVLKKTNLSRG
jgi:hypothetical protein